MQRRDQSRYRWLGGQCLQSARACIMLVWLALTLAANPVAAQTTTTYSNTAAGTINAATTCTAPLVRNFTVGAGHIVGDVDLRSEEHTSELQSLMRISYAVFCLKKKKQTTTSIQENT